MNESQITVIGNVASVPEVRIGKDSGAPFTVFSIAQNRSRREPNGEFVQTGTTFFEVLAFRVLGANVVDSIGIGDPIVVHGRFRASDWQSGDKRGTNVQIDATSIGPDLTFGTSVFTKRRKAVQRGQDRIDLEVGGMPMTVNSDGEVFEGPSEPADVGDDGSAGDFEDSPSSLVAS
ncbi:MAG: single-stranded DNA-binding protein [Ornithinimicrobium sp.]